MRLLYVILAVLGLSACGSGEIVANSPASPDQGVVTPQQTPQQPEESAPSQEEPALKITVGEYELLATFEDNSSAEEFQQLLAQGPVTIEMEDYGGFEKVGGLGQSLPTIDRQTTAQPGDVMLYQGNQIVLFYGSNSWSYTPLGTVDDLTGWAQALGRGDVEVTLSAAGE